MDFSFFIKANELYKNVMFLDKVHKYVWMEDKSYIKSVTQLLGSYSVPFDQNIIYSSSKKRGVTVETLKEEWSYKNKKGVYRGNLCHDYLEKLIQRTIVKNTNQVYDLNIEKLYEVCNEYYRNYKDRFVPIASEMVVGNKNLAGKFDHLCYDTFEKKITLIDYKTDNDLNKPVYNNFLDPISDVTNCLLNKYSLQVEIYTLLLKPLINVEQKIIVHISETGYKMIDSIPEMKEKALLLYNDNIEKNENSRNNRNNKT